MGDGNVELVHRAADAFNHQDFDAFLEFCDPEIEFVSRILDLEGGEPYRGPDGVRNWWDDLFFVSSDFSSEVEEVSEAGAVTVARVQHRGRGTTSGAPLDVLSWHVTEWRDGRAVWWRILASEDEAVEAAESRN